MDSGGGGPMQRQYREYTRYLRPVRPTLFTDLEMLQSIVQYLDPEEIASVSQLLGTRRGVIRITCKTMTSVEKLDEMVQRRRLAVGSVPLGLVDETGQFILVVLDNVPAFITEEQVDEEMSKYGAVVHSSKDYVEVHGIRIENERRNVLFTAIFNRSAVLNGELRIWDTTVFVKAPYLEPDGSGESAEGGRSPGEPGTSSSGGGGTNSAESSATARGLGVGSVDPSTIRSAAQAFQRKLQTSQQRAKERHLGAREKTNTAHHRMSYSPLTSGALDFSDQPPAATLPPQAIEKLQTATQLLEGLAVAEAASKNSGKAATAGSSSVVASKTVVAPGAATGPDVSRQLQKRTEAFEQLSQFLQ